MPTTLPVPSRVALRALRSLALGTSCTIVLSAGLLTEDRRRRIQAAREVHDNAKKLKASRKYHSTSSTPLETFEDQLLRYREDAIWLPSNVLKGTLSKGAIGNLTNGDYEVQVAAPAAKATKEGAEVGTEEPSPSPTQVPSLLRNKRQSHLSSRGRRSQEPPILTASTLALSQRPPRHTAPEPPKIPKQQLHNRQKKLANDVAKLLQQPENIDEAAARFFEAFEEGLPIEGSSATQGLIEVAIELANACEARLKLEESDRVFDIVLSSGSLQEEQFYSFHPEAVINRLLGSAHESKTSYSKKLRKASSIFLTKLKEKYKSMSGPMLLLGEKLCAETCRFKMYDLTLDICSRLLSTQEGLPPGAAGPLIIATNKKGHHKKVFRLFHKYYVQSTPGQANFYLVGGLTIDSILSTGRRDRAEQTLVAMHHMAEKSGISDSTTWYLKVLGSEWRTHHNLEQTAALFARLEPLIHAVQHPQGFYGAMIQFCIEAENEALAQYYYDKLRQSYPPHPGDVRIYGNFAFAKAKCHDWLGVKDDFMRMKDISSEPEYLQELGCSFAPILHLYAQSHSIGATEEFLSFFVDEVGIRPVGKIINIMVQVYGAAKETESLIRWLDYASEAGCQIDSVTFNTILNNCYEGWDFTFWEVLRLYKRVCQLGPLHTRFIDEETVPIIRRMALLGSPSQEELARRLDALKNLDRTAHDVPSSRSTMRAMALTLANENPDATLKIYACAEKDEVLESRHVNLAVKASLRLYPNNVEETLRHIQYAQELGVDVSEPTATIIIHQMRAMERAGVEDSRPLIELAERTISTLEKCGTMVNPDIITKAISILLKGKQYRLCLDVWESLSQRISFHQSSYDLVLLTVLLQAHIGLQDHVGIQWVIKTLSANEICPDTQFRLHLKNARRKTIDLLERPGQYSDNLRQFLDSVLEAIEVTRLMIVEYREDRKNFTYKVVQIMEKAIAVEAGRQVEDLNYPDAQGSLSKSSSVGLESWTAMPLPRDEKGYHDMDHPAPQILVAAGAG